MKANLVVRIVTAYGEIEGRLLKNRVVEELRNDTHFSVLYWNMEKISTYAAKKGWKINLTSRPE